MASVASKFEQMLFKNSKKIRSTSARYSCGTSFPCEIGGGTFSVDDRLTRVPGRPLRVFVGRACPWVVVRTLVPLGNSGLNDCTLAGSAISESSPFSPSWEDAGLLAPWTGATGGSGGGCKKSKAPETGGSSGRPKAKLLP